MCASWSARESKQLLSKPRRLPRAPNSWRYASLRSWPSREGANVGSARSMIVLLSVGSFRSGTKKRAVGAARQHVSAEGKLLRLVLDHATMPIGWHGLRASQMPSKAVPYWITCIVYDRQEKSSAKIKNVGATQVVAAQETRDLRGLRIWRAGARWHFREANSAGYRTSRDSISRRTREHGTGVVAPFEPPGPVPSPGSKSPHC